MEVTLRDRLVRPYTHVHVRLVPETGSPIIEAIRERTDSDGKALFRIRSEFGQSVRFQIESNETTLNNPQTINFVAVPTGVPEAQSPSRVGERWLTANWNPGAGAGYYGGEVRTDGKFNLHHPDDKVHRVRQSS